MVTTTIKSKPASKILSPDYWAQKIQSVPAIAVFALAGLLLGMCIYFGPLETYGPITSWYHSFISNEYWRHLLVRAYPETMFAAWFAQCVAIVSVVEGQLKRYRVFRTHELFWRPVAGILFTVPGAAMMASVLFFWNKFGIGSRVHSAAHAFCAAGSSGHCLSEHAVSVLSAHPGLLQQFEQSTLLDGQKKLIVLAGSFIFGIWMMKSYFLNVQGWLAENRIIEVDAKNKQREHKGKNPVPYTRIYHHLVPGFRNRINYAVANHTGGSTFDLNPQNHRTANNVIYKSFKAVVVAGVLGGLYIMFYIAQGTHLTLVVVH